MSTDINGPSRRQEVVITSQQRSNDPIPFISVITPAFNRADKISRVISSLTSQTYSNFEWIVIDDGSTDNLMDVIEQFKNQLKFTTRYLRLEANSGKHVAINRGVDLSRGELIVIADSDDEFTSETFEFFYKTWHEMPEADRIRIAGIRVCCMDQSGNRVSDHLETEPIVATMQEAFFKLKFRKESWCATRRDLHKQWKFPETHRGYYPEIVMWKHITSIAPYIFYNKVCRIYYIEYDGVSLMRSIRCPLTKVARNMVSGRSILEDIDYFMYAPATFLKSATIYGAYALLGRRFREESKLIRSARAKLLFWVCIPFSLVCLFILHLKFRNTAG